VGRDLQIQAIYAAPWRVAGILRYVAIRFDMLGGMASPRSRRCPRLLS